MIRGNHLVALGLLGLLEACSRPPAVSAEPDAGAHASTIVVQPASPPTTSEAAAAPTEPAPQGPAASGANDERRRVLVNLLSGSYRVEDLPESAADVGRPFDRGLRRRLTEVDVTPAARADVQIGRATPTVPVPNVDRVLAGLRPRFRQCYQLAADDPRRAPTGKLVVSFVVDEKGEVTSAKTVTNSGVAEASATCIVGHMRRPQFDPPQRPSTVTVQLDFTAGR